MSGSLAPFHIIESDSLQHSLILRNVDRRHPHFYFDDGDLLLASPSIDFRVHIRELVPRSTVLTYLLGSFDIGPAGRIVYVPILGESHDDWACLLGLIYEERGNSVACPSLRELLGVLRVSEKYNFARLQAWAMAHLRTDFFPNPQYFQDDPEGSEDAQEKLLNALEVIAASNFSRFETATLALAFYAVARRDPNAPATFKFAKKLSRTAWTIMLTGSKAIERRFEEFGDRIIAVTCVSRPTAVGHCASTCCRQLVEWIADAKVTAPDLLKMLRQLCNEAPPGPICGSCVDAARLVLQEETVAIYRSLPTYFGFMGYVDGWELTEDRKQFLLSSFRP